MIFDSHAHYDDEAFDPDREALLSGMNQAGISHIVNVGASLEGVQATVELTEAYPFLYGAVGVHPDHVGSLDEEKLAWMRSLCDRKKIVAVGEIGLDYYWDKESHDLQKTWFVRQLHMAQDAGLPVIIHSREAAKDTFDILKAEHSGKTGGVIHCYSYSPEMAKEYIAMGYYIGIGGVVTFKNAKKLVETAKEIPLERILVETDSPYLCPEPNRGKRNDSSQIRYVIDKIAAIRGILPEEVEKQTEINARNMYGLLQ